MLLGRYRSSGNFIADVKHIVENILLKAVNKELKGNDKVENIKLSNEVIHFLKTKLESKVVVV